MKRIRVTAEIVFDTWGEEVETAVKKANKLLDTHVDDIEISRSIHAVNITKDE